MKDEQLLKCAWEAREQANPWKSGTKVGCAILTDKGTIRSGWNIEGLWMTSIHAEVCAITHLARNERGLRIALVAEVEFFSPCGACLDWLIQYCSSNASVIVQNKRREIQIITLGELLPYYPRQ